MWRRGAKKEGRDWRKSNSKVRNNGEKKSKKKKDGNG